jgi:hypothetical protein
MARIQLRQHLYDVLRCTAFYVQCPRMSISTTVYGDDCLRQMVVILDEVYKVSVRLSTFVLLGVEWRCGLVDDINVCLPSWPPSA